MSPVTGPSLKTAVSPHSSRVLWPARRQSRLGLNKDSETVCQPAGPVSTPVVKRSWVPFQQHGRPSEAESLSILHKPPFINPRSPLLVTCPPRDQWLQGRACCPAGEVLPGARPRLHWTPGAQVQLRGSGPAQGLRSTPGAQAQLRGPGTRSPHAQG